MMLLLLLPLLSLSGCAFQFQALMSPGYRSDFVQSLATARAAKSGYQKATKPVQDFATELSHANYTGQLLRLKAGTYFLGDKSYGDVLVKRDYWYDAVLQRMQKWYEAGNTAVGVVGNPGIGKSMLGYLCLYRWRCEGKRVVVCKYGWQRSRPHLFCEDGVYILDDEQLDEELSRDDVMYLLDGMNPLEVGKPLECKMLLVTSPMHSRYHEAFKLPGYKLLYMDVWSLEELKNAARLLYPNMKDSEVLRQYYWWGGNPRFVFDSRGQFSVAYLDAAMVATVTFVRNPLNPALDNSARSAGPSAVLHLRADRDLERTWVTYSSEYVEQGLIQAALNQRQHDVTTFFSLACPGVGLDVLQVGRGEAWEYAVCHPVLMNGGTFLARHLGKRGKISPDEKFNVTLPKSPVTPPFSTVDEIRDELDGVYCQPASRTVAAIDSVRQPGDLYQITNAKKRTKAPDAEALLRAARFLRSDNITLYYVVPRRHFDNFTATGINVKGISRADAKAVRQIKRVVLAINDDLEEARKQSVAAAVDLKPNIDDL